MSDQRLSGILAGLAAFFGALAAAGDGLTLAEILTAVTAGLLAGSAPVAVPAVRAARARRRFERVERDLSR